MLGGAPGGAPGGVVTPVAVDEGEGVRRVAADEDESFNDVDDGGGDNIAELGVIEIFVIEGALV